MNEIVNLRRERRRRAAEAAAETARENRVRFGRTAAQREADQHAAERHREVLDGSRIAERDDGADNQSVDKLS